MVATEKLDAQPLQKINASEPHASPPRRMCKLDRFPNGRRSHGHNNNNKHLAHPCIPLTNNIKATYSPSHHHIVSNSHNTSRRRKQKHELSFTTIITTPITNCNRGEKN
ncbi:hypothetical protein M758_4G157900 [Ceratodon purpureus]|uniref:Uncharacterized protein n=1 Tax=Ceratodon purpureus TaxID=3225 RepID=A0A8T0IB98_CERPU|nr:hypothetical protein KC19_4G157500 [Ceratodon purpureus]KAG0619698.1 hypothetical protein M758_4G157900 [Ceratodon purpureus]